MSEENVELVRKAFAANRSGPPEETVEVALRLAHPDAEFVSRLNSVEGSTYRGTDAFRQYYADLADAFSEWTNAVAAIEDLGSDTVLSDATFHGTSHSGVDVELRTIGIWKIRDGKVVSLHAYESREEALAAVGRDESQ